MMKNIYLSLCVAIFMALLLASCDNAKNGETDFENTLPEIIRYDQLLMNLDSMDIQRSFGQLYDKYPDFTDIYFLNVLPFPGYENRSDTFYRVLNAFITDEKIREVNRLVQKNFPDLKEEKMTLAKAFHNAGQWIPGIRPPQVYTFLSEFSFQRFIFQDGDKDGLGIGLDLFLGDDFEYARLEQGLNTFANYLTRTYNKEHLIKKSIDAWLEDQMGLQSGNRLIDQMMYNGKKLYILDQLTEVPDSVLFEYTEEQYQWIENNERELWAFMFERDWFYTTDQYVIKRLVDPAPNTVALGMPQNAPGQTGNYLGYRIIESYMKRYPETDFQQLISMDAQQLLEKSKFKPGKR